QFLRSRVRKSLNADPKAAHHIRLGPSVEQYVPSMDMECDSRTFRSLLDRLEVGVAIADLSGKIFYANPRFAEFLTGSSYHQVCGVELKKFVLATSWNQLSDALSRGAHSHTEGEMKVLPSGNGGRRTIHLSFTPHDSVEGQDRVRILATETTALRAANRALKRSEASVHKMSARLLQVQDEERRRIARDLH